MAKDCDTILKYNWFAAWRDTLGKTVAKCALAPAQVIIYPVRIGSEAKLINSCAGTLTDGEGKYGYNWNRVATIDAGPGKKARLTLKTLGLAPGKRATLVFSCRRWHSLLWFRPALAHLPHSYQTGDIITVYDGDSDKYRLPGASSDKTFGKLRGGHLTQMDVRIFSASAFY